MFRDVVVDSTPLILGFCGGVNLPFLKRVRSSKLLVALSIGSVVSEAAPRTSAGASRATKESASPGLAAAVAFFSLASGAAQAVQHG